MSDQPAIVDLCSWRTIRVTGPDALEWLDDLVSAGVSGLRPHESRRSLLLTPTGRIRADFHVTAFDDGFQLIQDPIQPKPIDALLGPYVLSSEVVLDAGDDDDFRPAMWKEDMLAPIGWTFETPAMSLEQFDEWRIRRGIPRFGVDLDEESLPQEAGWERFIDFTKGCFMGQEAMAKIRNMGGHPTRVVRPLRAEMPAAEGEAIMANGHRVGVVTSAGGTDVIARISWPARDETLTTESGVALSDRA